MNAIGQELAGYGLYLDLQVAQLSSWLERGTVRYAHDYAQELLKRPGLVRGIGLNPTMPFPAGLSPELLSCPHLEWATAANLRRAEAEGPLAYHVLAPNIVSAIDNFSTQALKPHVPLVMTLADVFVLSFPEEAWKQREIAKRMRIRSRLIQTADLVLTISDFTRSEAISWLDLEPARVVAVGTGVTPYFRPEPNRRVARKLVQGILGEITRPFVLSVLGPWKRKNTERLIEAFAKLPPAIREAYQLVVVCRLTDEYRIRWTDLARQCGLGDGELILTDLITQAVLRALYQTASLFVYPPLQEGFGLPAAEAAACGCPTITSNTSSMPEVLNFEPATFPPEDTDRMATAILRGLLDEEFRSKLIAAASWSAAHHTWDKVVDRTVAALQLLGRPGIDRPAASAADMRLRLAVVGGLPRIRNNNGATARNVVGPLAAQCDIDLYGCNDDAVASLRGRGVRSFPLAALGRHMNPAGYDALIYTVGSEEDLAVGYKAQLFPGIVWLQPSFRPETFAQVLRPMLESALGLLVTDPEHSRELRFRLGPYALLPAEAVVSNHRDVLRLVRRFRSLNRQYSTVANDPSAEVSLGLPDLAG